jgi:glutathione synthase/RimK-type ligase-like ATP-grasp enzyme
VQTLVVLENPREWDLNVPGVEVVSARSYLLDPRFPDLRAARVYNMCRSYRYQSLGYYVSLVAAARGHKPLPSIATIQDLKSRPIIRVVAQDLDEMIRHDLAHLRSLTFTLSIYFGSNVAKRYDRLSRALFNQFPAPFLRAGFKFHAEDGWMLDSLRPIAASEIPEVHDAFIRARAVEYFSRPRRHAPARREPKYDLAILVNEHEPTPPSDAAAIRRFIRAAEALDFAVEVIDKDDYGRLAEFDALFIRETTGVNHHTFRFARRAAAEGLVVIDDPESILRCGNKVYLAELLERHQVPTPKTLIISEETAGSAGLAIGFPCIVKQPDSSFSQGVVKAENETEFAAATERLFKGSELLIVQEFLPTAFDWRVGVLDREPLFVCKYFMAREHWQILDHSRSGEEVFGRVRTLALDEAPAEVVRAAVRAAKLIGDGLYGVDLKEVGGRIVVIEVNDNPSIDAGYEDKLLGMELYDRIMAEFAKRIEAMRI